MINAKSNSLSSLSCIISKCSNPRCITSIEKDLDQIFILTDKETNTYRCKYCESKV